MDNGNNFEHRHRSVRVTDIQAKKLIREEFVFKISINLSLSLLQE